MLFEHWVNAYFLGKIYDHVSSTVSESSNSWTLEEQQLPITSMLDLIQRRLTMNSAGIRKCLGVGTQCYV